MSVPVAYLGIVLIWSTTPLAIQWSAQEAGYSFAVLARMAIGLTVAWPIWSPCASACRCTPAPAAPTCSAAWRCSAPCPDPPGARFIHSGLISVLFGLSPLLTSALARVWLDEPPLRPTQLAGLLLGVAGLGDHLPRRPWRRPDRSAGRPGRRAHRRPGSFGGLVGLKRIADDSPPPATTVGTLGRLRCPCSRHSGGWPTAVRPLGHRPALSGGHRLPGRLRLGHRLCVVLLRDQASRRLAHRVDYADYAGHRPAARPCAERLKPSACAWPPAPPAFLAAESLHQLPSWRRSVGLAA